MSKNTPNHVAIIMDGNRRWAKQKMLKTFEGHSKGSQNIENICKAAISCGVGVLTIYAFSSENWSRDSGEITYLKDLMLSYLNSKSIEKLIENKIVIKVIGSPQDFGDEVCNKIAEVESKSLKINGGNCSLTLNIALSYGAKNEIVKAVKTINEKKLEINAENISSHLQQTADVDLLIRTGGDFRLSNFLLWQCAYAELFFTQTLWPDFNESHFASAITFFQSQKRNFGC